MLVRFGCIFRLNENKYVYLGQTDDIIYAARILDLQQTRQLTSLSETRAKRGQGGDSTIFCFVILNTADFEGQAAYLNETAQETNVNIDPYDELCEEDVNNLVAIIREDKAIPRGLKEIVVQTFGEV